MQEIIHNPHWQAFRLGQLIVAELRACQELVSLLKEERHAFLSGEMEETFRLGFRREAMNHWIEHLENEWQRLVGFRPYENRFSEIEDVLRVMCNGDNAQLHFIYRGIRILRERAERLSAGNVVLLTQWGKQPGG